MSPDSPHAKDRPWLQRDELRKAISYAVDRQAFVDTVFLGNGVPVYGPITPGHGEWYAPDLPTTPVDRAKARALLASLGLVDRDGDGVLEDARGRPARFSILTTKGNTNRERARRCSSRQLKAVGLDVDVVKLDAKQVVSQWAKRRLRCDLLRHPVRLPRSRPQSRVLDELRVVSLLGSGTVHAPATTWEARIDDLMRKQATTINPDERRRLFREVQAIFLDHMPCLYFGAPRPPSP